MPVSWAAPLHAYGSAEAVWVRLDPGGGRCVPRTESGGREGWWPNTAADKGLVMGHVAWRRRGQFLWGWQCAWHCLCSVCILGGGFQWLGACSAACAVCVSAMRGGGSTSVIASAAGGVDTGTGRVLRAGQGGHPVRACSVPVWEWEGMGRNSVSAVSEGNSICWRRVWGCLVTVQQRGDAVPTIAVCWGCAVPLLRGEARACGVCLHCSAGWAVSHS